MTFFSHAIHSKVNQCDLEKNQKHFPTVSFCVIISVPCMVLTIAVQRWAIMVHPAGKGHDREIWAVSVVTESMTPVCKHWACVLRQGRTEQDRVHSPAKRHHSQALSVRERVREGVTGWEGERAQVFVFKNSIITSRVKTEITGRTNACLTRYIKKSLCVSLQ